MTDQKKEIKKVSGVVYLALPVGGNVLDIEVADTRQEMVDYLNQLEEEKGSELKWVKATLDYHFSQKKVKSFTHKDVIVMMKQVKGMKTYVKRTN